MPASSHRFPPARALATVLSFVLAGCAGGMAGSSDAGAAATLTSQQIAAIVAATDRSAADRTNDQRRKPEQMLAFIGVRPGIVALDVSAAGGYTTELLARAIGPSGIVYGQSRPLAAAAAAVAPSAAEGGTAAASAPAPAPAPAMRPPQRRTSPEQLAERSNNLQANHDAAASIVPVVQPFENPVPAERAEGGLDLVTLMFNYHDLGWMGVDRARLNAAVFRALKPGGVYVLADHAGRPGTGISESGTLHRIEESFLRAEVEAAGFRLAQEGTFLRNPNDPRDKNTPEPPQPKDDFVLKFVKPR
jgi:predicted methyltransferase